MRYRELIAACFIIFIYWFLFIGHLSGRRGGLMVSALVLGSSGPGSNPGRGTLCCVRQDTVPLSELLGKPNKLRRSELRWTSVPKAARSRNTPSSFMLQKPGHAPAAISQYWLQSFTRGVEILLAASCYRNRDTLRQL